MEIIVVEVKLLTSNMSNCWSTGSNWFSCGVVYFYKFILPLIHRFGRRSQKRLASAGLFFVIYRLTCNVIGHCTKLDWISCLYLYSDGGIIGTAMASLLAQLVSFLYCCSAIARIEYVSLTKQDLCFDFYKIGTMLLFGFPISFQYVVITMGGMILQSSINLQGSIFIAGYTATNKLYGFLQCFAMSVGQASCTFVSQNYGAGLGQRVRQGVADSVKIVMAMAILIMTVTLMTRSQLLCVFLDHSNTDGIQTLAVAVRYLTIMVFLFPILHILYVFRNVLQALGVAIWSLMSGFAELAARILMSKCVIGYIGADALFYPNLRHGLAPCSVFFCLIFITEKISHLIRLYETHRKEICYLQISFCIPVHYR